MDHLYIYEGHLHKVSLIGITEYARQITKIQPEIWLVRQNMSRSQLVTSVGNIMSDNKHLVKTNGCNGQNRDVYYGYICIGNIFM